MNATVYSSLRHAVFLDPAVMAEIRTVPAWSKTRTDGYLSRQKDYRRIEHGDLQCAPGYFASEAEFWFYKLLQRCESADQRLIFSNVPVAEVFTVDEHAFTDWYQGRRYKPRGEKFALQKCSTFGGKSVDLIVVDRSSDTIVSAFEVDGPDHERTQEVIDRDFAKSQLFRQNGLELLRICPASVLNLTKQANGERFDTVFRETLDKMRENWRVFVEAPSIVNMQLHLSTRLVAG